MHRPPVSCIIPLVHRVRSLTRPGRRWYGCALRSAGGDSLSACQWAWCEVLRSEVGGLRDRGGWTASNGILARGNCKVAADDCVIEYTGYMAGACVACEDKAAVNISGSSFRVGFACARGRGDPAEELAKPGGRMHTNAHSMFGASHTCPTCGCTHRTWPCVHSVHSAFCACIRDTNPLLQTSGYGVSLKGTSRASLAHCSMREVEFCLVAKDGESATLAVYNSVLAGEYVRNPAVPAYATLPHPVNTQETVPLALGRASLEAGGADLSCGVSAGVGWRG